MVLQGNIFKIYQRLEAAESALILTITTCFVGPTNFESSSIHNYCYTCLYLPDKFPKLFVLLRRNFNDLSIIGDKARIKAAAPSSSLTQFTPSST